MLIGSETNVSKCKSQVPNLNLDGSIISFSSFVTNLGVEFDETLSFKKTYFQRIQKSYVPSP